MDIMLSRIVELLGNKRGAAKNLASYLGISANRITDWKSGRIATYPKYAPKIAEYYGVSLDWLCGHTDIKNKPTIVTDDELLKNDEDFNSLSPEGKAKALEYVRFLLEQEQKHNQ